MKFYPKTLIILIIGFYSLQTYAQEFTLGFSDARADCNAMQVCYDVTISSNGGTFGLGSYNLRLFYDASRISYAANSPNLNNLPGAYSISGVEDQSADLTGLGSLSFENTLGFLEIGVDYIPSTPATVNNADLNALQNLCFNVTDASILNDPASCFDLIWVNETSRDSYTNAVTTVNNAADGSSLDLNNSIYVDLTSASNCLVDACVDPADMITFELGFTNGVLDCEAQTACYNITIESPDNFDLGSYNLRIFYDADLLDLIDASPNLNPGSVLDGSYTISSVEDMQGGNQSLNGTLPFDDNLDILDIAVDYLGANPIVAGAAPQIITYDLCFNVLEESVVMDPSVCIHAVWVTNATEENYTNGETTVNVAGAGMTTDIDASIYNDLEPTGAQCFVNACIELSDIPTLGEWGLICLSLILLIFGVIAIREFLEIYNSNLNCI